MCGCLVTWFCYHLIAKPGNKTAAPLWPDPYITLKTEGCHDANFIITGGTTDCIYDILLLYQWWKNQHHNNLLQWNDRGFFRHHVWYGNSLWQNVYQQARYIDLSLKINLAAQNTTCYRISWWQMPTICYKYHYYNSGRVILIDAPTVNSQMWLYNLYCIIYHCDNEQFCMQWILCVLKNIVPCNRNGNFILI